MIEPTDITTFTAALAEAKTIFITAHVGPDGDTLGSMLGLKHAIIKHFKHIERVDCVISGLMPDVFNFMPGIDSVKDVDTATDLLSIYDLAFCVDCGSGDRLGPSRAYFDRAKHSINIDHHISNTRFGKANIIDADAAASGEVIADLLNGSGIVISKESAICLYVAVLTDTGGFKYSSTSAKVFDLVAALTRLGANPEKIYRHIYEEVPKAQALLTAEVIRNAQFNPEETLCWSHVSRELMAHFDATDEHVEGIVESLRRIETVQICALLKETRNGMTKISLRSDTPSINVSDIMANWGGGGHKMAAGCTINQPLAEAEKELMPHLYAALESVKQPVG